MRRKIKIRKLKPLLRLFRKASIECSKKPHHIKWDAILLRCTMALHFILGTNSIDKLLDESGIYGRTKINI